MGTTKVNLNRGRGAAYRSRALLAWQRGNRRARQPLTTRLQRWTLLTVLVVPGSMANAAETLFDLRDATVVVHAGAKASAEQMAAELLVDEVARRVGVKWPVRGDWPSDPSGPVVAIATIGDLPDWAERIPKRANKQRALGRRDGYVIATTVPGQGGPVAIFIVGADPRGTLFGVGHLLRALRWTHGSAGRLEVGRCDIATAPAFPIRGHQLGYRARANSYDAWTPQQYEQYIRTLIVFGTNAIENIPFQDDQPSPVMAVSRDAMNVALSDICHRYDLDYWIWTPVSFKLPDDQRLARLLARHEALYRKCRRLDAVFVPGGDPGDNSARQLMPVVARLGQLLIRYHPHARVYVSLQGFGQKDVDEFFAYIDRHAGAWFGGVVCGPSSPDMAATRTQLPRKYRLRWYPDITHTVRCQYPVPWWDPAFALTLGREPPNPRPLAYRDIFLRECGLTDGFVTYSDGIHDDVNKALWSMLGWNPRRDPRSILVDYSRFFFGADVAEAAADGLLALEKNWVGSLAENSSVDGTLKLWQALARQSPELRGSWRFELCCLRAYYDTYTRQRLRYETELEQRALQALASASRVGVNQAMDQALEFLAKAETAPRGLEYRAKIDTLAAKLFRQIGYQTSVSRYHASGPERGAIIDFVDHPLNDRWYLEDALAKVRQLDRPTDQIARLETLRTWNQPAPGSFYDDIGHVGRCPHVVASPGPLGVGAAMDSPIPGHAWWNSGNSRTRLAWQHAMAWPRAVRYRGLDPHANYVVRTTGRGATPLRADGQLLSPSRRGTQVGQVRQYAVPHDLVADATIELTWDPADESHINWRNRSQVAEVWLIKLPATGR